MESLESLSDTEINTAFGRYRLHRYPVLKKPVLRAWDAADEYLLAQLAENNLPGEITGANSAVLIINDAFGALSLSLRAFSPVMMTDSYLSMQAITANCTANFNTSDCQAITVLNTLADPAGYFPDSAGGKADIVLLKIPKSLAMLEDQLHRLRPLLTPDSVIIAAAMSKNIHKSTLALFEKIIGPTKTSLARKKARLVFVRYDADLAPKDNPWPKSWTLALAGEVPAEKTLTLSDHAGLFSAGRLDIGSRFMLQHIPADDRFRTIVDLACGNGVLGIAAAIKNPQARLVFTDESWMAVESAATNFEALFALGGEQAREAEFLQTDCLQGVAAGSASLVLCNPPFHQHHAVSDHIAWQMFTEAREVLHKGGELWVVGNRHLGYHAKLKRLFGNREVIDGNKKFVIIKAVRS